MEFTANDTFYTMQLDRKKYPNAPYHLFELDLWDVLIENGRNMMLMNILLKPMKKVYFYQV